MDTPSVRASMSLGGPAIILLVTGILLFGASAAGLYAQGGVGAITTNTTSSSGLFNLTFTTGSTDVGSQQVADYSTTTKDFDVKIANITTVSVKVSCSDPAGGAGGQASFKLNIKVDGPQGLTGSKTNEVCGPNTQVIIEVAPVPSGGAVNGQTKEEAQKNIPTSGNATKGTGAWKVTVTGNRGGMIPALAANPAGSISMAAMTWKPVLVANSK